MARVKGDDHGRQLRKLISIPFTGFTFFVFIYAVCHVFSAIILPFTPSFFLFSNVCKWEEQTYALLSSSIIRASDSTAVIGHCHCLFSCLTFYPKKKIATNSFIPRPRMKSWRSKEPTMGKSSSTDEHVSFKFHGNMYDPRLEFLQFLEEARESGVEASNCRKEGDRITPEAEEERKKKKSWRKGLLSWWKSEEKKSKEGEGKLHRHSHLPSTRSVNASGPVRAVNGSHRLSLSGPLSSLFKSSTRDGTQIRYSSIHNLHSSPAVARTYGPIYLVT